jgi:hypothetical protein
VEEKEVGGEKKYSRRGPKKKSQTGVNEGQADNALGKLRWQKKSTRDGRLTICQPSMILPSRPQQAKAMPRSVSDGSDRVPAPLLEGLPQCCAARTGQLGWGGPWMPLYAKRSWWMRRGSWAKCVTHHDADSFRAGPLRSKRRSSH